jgi:hypothetical protein
MLYPLAIGLLLALAPTGQAQMWGPLGSPATYQVVPQVVYYPPAVVEPAAQVSYYAGDVACAPHVVSYAPAATAVLFAPVVRTAYYEPVVTYAAPVTTFYAPVTTYAARPVVVGPRGRVFVPGEPVRNFFRWLAPAPY